MTLNETLGNLQQAEKIWQGMSPISRYRLINRLPYVAGMTARCNACIHYIADHPEEFNEAKQPDTRFDNLDDGDIHRFI